MVHQGILNLKSLKEQVYEYLRTQLQKGEIKPGSVINMEETSQKLGVSRTPLRDALFRLESEDFVTILPRRGVFVNHLSLQDVKNYYEIIGSLESRSVLSAGVKIKESDIRIMLELNRGMNRAISQNNFDGYYKKNLKFHNIYLDLSGNKYLVRTVTNLKKRLYDFPRKKGFLKEWEDNSILEHQDLVKLIAQKQYKDAACFIRDVHWSYNVQEKYIKKYYRQTVAYSEERDI